MEMTAEDLRWLTHRWLQFRDAMRVIGARHCDVVVAEIIDTGKATDGSWGDFIAAVLKEFEAGRARRPELFGIALDLFADPTPLRRTLEEAGAQLGGGQAAAVRAVALKRGLTRMRDIRIGGTEHRGKTWAKLDRVSRVFARDQAEETGFGARRCTMDHFVDLLGHIKEHHPADHNLPRTLKGIEEYFHDFCDECGHDPVGDDSDPERRPDGYATLLPDAELRAINLAECVAGLGEEQRTFVEAKFQMSDPVEISVVSFCKRTGVERTRFLRVVDRALAALRDCLTSKASDSYGAALGYRSAWQEI